MKFILENQYYVQKHVFYKQYQSYLKAILLIILNYPTRNHNKFLNKHFIQMLSHEQQEKILGSMLAKSCNTSCADCGSKSPCWVSLDFGVFVCLNCSGAHRSLGPSITRVRSTKLDKWNKEWLWFMQLGNEAINEYFQYQKDALSIKKPNINSSLNQIKRFVYDKYVKKLYTKPGQEDPITRLKKGTYKKEEAAPIQKEEGKKQISAASKAKEDKKPPQKVVPKKKQIDIDLLGDHFSNIQVGSTSLANPKAKEEINLFDDFQTEKPTKLYNKDHFNSFSGKGASHSTTGHFNFDDFLGNKAATKDDFKQFTQLTEQFQQKKHNFATINSHQYHQQPSFNLYNSTNMNSHYQPYHHQPPMQGPFVTMNINMNMYPNYMNVNMNGVQMPGVSQQPNQSSQPSQPQPNPNFLDIKLDLNDLKQKQIKKQVVEEKSWVDEWK